MHNGHIFCIGREYRGPFANVLTRNNKNVPVPTGRDMHTAWKKVYEQLPECLKKKGSQREWRQALNDTHAWRSHEMEGQPVTTDPKIA